MGLVDYSDSESDSDTPSQPTSKPTSSTTTSGANTKKSFQKVVDRSNPGKIKVSLPQTRSDGPNSTGDEPPAKKPKIGGGGGGGLFSGLNSFLPAPKNAGKPPAAQSKSGSLRPAFQLKTSAEAGFSRDAPPPEEYDGSAPDITTTEDAGGSSSGGGGLKLPPPKAAAQPSVPEGMKAEEDVKLVGKPMMFRPLSVARGNKKKPQKKAPVASSSTSPPATTATAQTKEPVSLAIETKAPEAAEKPPAPKKTPLFSFTADPEPDTGEQEPAPSGSYEPLFAAEPATDSYGAYAASAAAGYANQPTPTTAPVGSNDESLEYIANDLNLSAAERRELFGRGGAPGHATKVINFNTDQEYQHNEELRAAGEQQTHNPVRSIAPGKHSLRQLVHQVQNQKDALEDSFAKGKSNRKEASSRYGW